jgi:hypothetical protein
MEVVAREANCEGKSGTGETRKFNRTDAISALPFRADLAFIVGEVRHWPEAEISTRKEAANLSGLNFCEIPSQVLSSQGASFSTLPEAVLTILARVCPLLTSMTVTTSPCLS